MTRSWFALSILVLLVACGKRTVVEVPASHPASPSAAQAPLPEPSTTLAITPDQRDRTDAPRADPDHADHQRGKSAPTSKAEAEPVGPGHQGHGTPSEGDDTKPPGAAVAYRCPMHPEVTSDKPGTCPKCEMKLEPVESSAGGGP